MKMSWICMKMNMQLSKTHFHMHRFTPGIVLRQWQGLNQIRHLVLFT